MCSFSRPSKLTSNCLFLNCQLFIYEQSGYNCWSYLTLFDWLCTTMFNFSSPFSSIFYNLNFNKITSIHFSWIGEIVNCHQSLLHWMLSSCPHPFVSLNQIMLDRWVEGTYPTRRFVERSPITGLRSASLPRRACRYKPDNYWRVNWEVIVFRT